MQAQISVFALTALGLFSLPSAEFFDSKATGLATFTFAERFQSPRNAALEGAGAGTSSSDPGVITSNPAALDLAGTQQVGLYWTSGIWEESRGTLHWAFPMRNIQLSLNYGWSGAGTIDGLDEEGLATGNSYEPSSQQFSAGLALPLEHMRFGTTARLLTDNLSEDPGDQTAMAWALDWGLLYQPSTPTWSAGISVLNLGRQERAYTQNGVVGTPLNTTLRAALHLRPRALPRLSLLTDAEAPRHTPARLRIGGEYLLSQQLVLRGGIRRDWVESGRLLKSLLSIDSPEYEGGHLHQFSLGAGLRMGIVQADYAFTSFRHDIGYEQRIGLTALF